MNPTPATTSPPACPTPRPPVFFLGCFESRVTIYSQQVRAFQLAFELLHSGAIRPHGKMAVVGGGIGGATLAAMLAIAAPELRIVLFEAQDSLMHLQQGARDRYVHPHVFDWPAAGSLQRTAGLPWMDWEAGSADRVVAQLAPQFEKAMRRGLVEIRMRSAVQRIDFVGPDVCVVAAGRSDPGETFDAVALCIGFGYERRSSPRNPSYWSPSLLPAPLLPPRPQTVFISGNGDGGLADFALAAFRGLTHEAILTRVLDHVPAGPVVDLLLALDDEAWSNPAFDLFEAYSSQAGNLVSTHLLRDVNDMLRPEAHVILHTQEPRLFRRETALLNRFVAFLAIHADRTYGRNAIEVIVDVPLTTVGERSDELTLGNGRNLHPDLRLLRFGPEREELLRPFQGLVQGGTRATIRPADPVLSGAARRWAEEAVRTAGLHHAPASAATAAAGAHPPSGSPAAAVSVGQGFAVNVVHGDVREGATVTQTYIGR